jgi:zinc protease
MRIILLLITFFWTMAGMAADSVQAYQLSNGLTLLVKEDHRAPVVISQLWYKVGSSYEVGGITGISHALEHMMFRGTEKYGPGVLNQMVADNGGEQNAFTDRDFTAYYQTWSSDKLPLSFELEADRMKNLLLRPEDFAKEIQVVMEERRMRTEDIPQSLAYERLLAAAFISSPYHHPVVGWMNDLQNMQIADLRQWYNDWYAPNNAVLVVVGDVQPEKVHQLAQKYFADIKPKKLPVLKPQNEVAPIGERRVKINVPARLPYLMMAYNVPVVKELPADSQEPYALEVLAMILGGSDASRLSQILLREKNTASAASASYSAFSRKSDIFLIDLVPTPGKSLAENEMLINNMIHDLQTKPVSDEELSRAKAKLLAQQIYAKDSLFFQAYQLGSLAAVGLPWELAQAYPEKINAVTAAEVQKVASKYLISDRATVAMLEPKTDAAPAKAKDSP